MQVQPCETRFQSREIWLLTVFSASTGGSLSPELCGRIVKWARASDLPFLARTCKSFQSPSEKRLYDIVILGDPTVAFDACRSIATADRLGPYVRQFFIYQDDRRYRNVTLHLQFWQMVQAAMSQMCHLEKLYIHDPAGHNTFILNPAHLNFQLDDAQLRLDWDAHMVAFLTDQQSLEHLTVMHGPDNFEHPLEPEALPDLKQFIGSITVAIHLLTRPLTHLQIHVDETSNIPLLSFIPHLSATRATLCSLSFLELPDSIAVDALRLVAAACPDLRYVGVLPFPSRHVSRICHSRVNPIFILLTARKVSSFSHEHAQSPGDGIRPHQVGPTTNWRSSKNVNHGVENLLSICRIHRILGWPDSFLLDSGRRQLDVPI